MPLRFSRSENQLLENLKLTHCVFTVTSFQLSSILFLCIFSVGAVALSQDEEISANCPNDLPYTTAMKFFHGTCYQFVSQEKYWHQARDFCLLVNLRNC